MNLFFYLKYILPYNIHLNSYIFRFIFLHYRKSPEKEIRYFNAKRWDRIPESKRYLPLAEGLNRVAEGNLAYHTSIDSAYPYIERHFYPRMICELTEIHLFRAVLAFWGRHRSPFTPLLRIG